MWTQSIVLCPCNYISHVLLFWVELTENIQVRVHKDAVGDHPEEQKHMHLITSKVKTPLPKTQEGRIRHTGYLFKAT